MHPKPFDLRGHQQATDIYGFRQKLYANRAPMRTATIARKTITTTANNVPPFPLNQLLLSQSQRWQNTLDGIEETSSIILPSPEVASLANRQQQQEFTYGANFNTDFNSQYSNTAPTTIPLSAPLGEVPINKRTINSMLKAMEAKEKRAARGSIPSKIRRSNSLNSNNSLKNFSHRIFNKMKPSNCKRGSALGNSKTHMYDHLHEMHMPPSDLIRLFGETSLPGVRDIALSRSFLRRIFWVISFFFFGFLALRDISQLVSEYYTYPITVDVRLRDSRRLQFPAVTVCNLNIVRYSALCVTNVSAIKDSMIPRDLREKLCAIQPSAAAKDAKDAKDAKEFAALAAAAVSAAGSTGNSETSGSGNKGNGGGNGAGVSNHDHVTTAIPLPNAGSVTAPQSGGKPHGGHGGAHASGHGNNRKKQHHNKHHHGHSSSTTSSHGPSRSSSWNNNRGKNTNTTPTIRTKQPSIGVGSGASGPNMTGLGTTTASTTDGDSIQDDINSYGVMSKHKANANDTAAYNGTVDNNKTGNQTDSYGLGNFTTTMSSTSKSTSTTTTTSPSTTSTSTSTTSTSTSTTTALPDIPNDISMPIPESTPNKRSKRKAKNSADLLLNKVNNITSTSTSPSTTNQNQFTEVLPSNSTTGNGLNVSNPSPSPPEQKQQQQLPQAQPNKQSTLTKASGEVVNSPPILPENDIELTEREEKELQENLTNWLAVIYNSNEKIAQQLGHQFEDFILRCTIRSTNCTSEESFESFFTPTEGNCFTFKGQKLRKNYLDRIKDETSIAGVNYGLEFVLNLEISEYLTGTTQIGAIIMIQHPDEIGNSASEAIFVAPQQSTYIGLKMINITRLPKPYPEDCIDHWPAALIGRLTQNASYSQQACLKICLQRTIHTRCKCQSAMLPQLELNSTLKICDTRRRSTRKCVEEVMFQAEEKVSTCKCPPRCQVINYDKTVSMTKWPTREDKVTFDRGKANINFQNLAKVTVYFQTMTCQEVRQEKAYTTAKLFSSLGGILGMYVGFSFLSLFEILEVFVRRFWYFLTKKRSRFRAAVHTITATFAFNPKRNSMPMATATKDFELEKEMANMNMNNNTHVTQRLPMATSRYPNRLNQTYHHGLV